MAYAYTGENYRGGAEGVQSDFDLRRMFAEQAAAALSQGQGYATQDQVWEAQNKLDPIYQMYQGMAMNGMYTPEDQEQLLSARTQEVNNTTRAMQQNLNAQVAQRGGGGNAGQQAAVGMRGQFEAAGQRGQAQADITAANIDTKIHGMDKLAGTANTMAEVAMQPTRMDINENDYMGLYDQYRNAQVGYDGANWATEAPEQPAHYDYDADVEEDVDLTGKKKKKGNEYDYSRYSVNNKGATNSYSTGGF